jgi:hypothetical protein
MQSIVRIPAHAHNTNGGVLIVVGFQSDNDNRTEGTRRKCRYSFLRQTPVSSSYQVTHKLMKCICIGCGNEHEIDDEELNTEDKEAKE